MASSCIPASISPICSLPYKLLRRIAYDLDPSSLVAFMEAFPEIEQKLVAETSKFWVKLGQNWGFPANAILKCLPHYSASGATLADAIVALMENVRLGRCEVWRWDMSNDYSDGTQYGVPRKPVVIQRDAELLLSDVPYHDNCGGFSSLNLWNPRSGAAPGIAKAVGSITEKDFNSGQAVKWMDFLLRTPRDAVERPEEIGDRDLVILEIYDLSDNVGDGTGVRSITATVHFEAVSPEQLQDLKYVSGFASFVGVMFDVINDNGATGGKAIVRHRLVPDTIFIVSLPKGIIERKIILPYHVAFTKFLTGNRSFASSNSLITAGCKHYLAFSAPNPTETKVALVARSIPANNTGKNSVIVPEGAVITLLNDGTLSIFRTNMRSDGGLMLSVDQEMPVQLMLPDLPPNHKLAEVEICHEVSVVLAVFKGTVDSHGIYAVKYNVGTANPSLHLLYKVDIGLTLAANICLMPYGRLVAIGRNPDRNTFLTFIEVSSGNVVGQVELKNRDFRRNLLELDFDGSKVTIVPKYTEVKYFVAFPRLATSS